jgi:hypothetical protein
VFGQKPTQFGPINTVNPYPDDGYCPKNTTIALKKVITNLIE